MTRFCVYTSVAGGYERRLYKPRAQAGDVRFICFSDDPMPASNGWELRELQSPPGIGRPDLVNRYHKFFAHRLFPEVDYSIYVDANLQVTGNLLPLVEQVRSSGALLGAARHPERESYVAEFDVCVRTRKFKMDDGSRAEAQQAHYRQEGLPQTGLLAAGLIVRRHHSPELDAAMALWWEQVRRYTARDQISLPYVLWKTRLPHTAFDFNILRDNRYTSIHGHGQQPTPLQLMKRRIAGALRRFTEGP